MSNKTPASFIERVTSPVGISVIVIVSALLSLGVYLYTQTSLQLPSFLVQKTNQKTAIVPTPGPTSRPIKKIPTGKQVYNVSNGPKVVGPKIQKITLDPQTPTSKEKQTVTIIVKNDSPVTQASAFVQTDYTEIKHDLALIEGTTTDGTWQGSWNIIDTYDYNYFIRFDLISETGEYNDGIRLR